MSGIISWLQGKLLRDDLKELKNKVVNLRYLNDEANTVIDRLLRAELPYDDEFWCKWRPLENRIKDGKQTGELDP